MNILTHPVTPIVAFVVVVAGIIAVVTTVRSKRRKERERQKRAMEARVAKTLADEMFKPKPTRTVPMPRSATTNRYRKPGSVPAPGRPGFRQDAPSRSRADVDHNDSLFIPSLIVADSMHSDPTPSRDHSPSHDSGSSSSSSSHDSGSSSSSSDSGSSFSSDSGGGGDF